MEPIELPIYSEHDYVYKEENGQRVVDWDATRENHARNMDRLLEEMKKRYGIKPRGQSKKK